MKIEIVYQAGYYQWKLWDGPDGIDYYFKASSDKANRTSVDGKRGRGLHDTVSRGCIVRSTDKHVA